MMFHSLELKVNWNLNSVIKNTQLTEYINRIRVLFA